MCNGLAYRYKDDAYIIVYAYSLSYVIVLSAKITQMTTKFTITPEYKNERGTLTQTGLFCGFFFKKIICSV